MLFDSLFFYTTHTLFLNSVLSPDCTGTCRSGYKRHGESTKCKQCPDTGTNRALLVVGFFVMILGSAILIYMTIKDQGEEEDQEYELDAIQNANRSNAEKTSPKLGEKYEIKTSDAVKKIILNFLQMLSLA